MPDSILASHILIAYQGAARSTAKRAKAEALELASELSAQLKAGADFETLAKNNSDCASASRGGDLGLFSKGQMVPAFDAAAFALAEDELSPVVETEFGYHLIMRLG